MKLTYFQLGPQLNKKLLPAYLISGDDRLLKQNAAKLVCQAAKKHGFNDITKFAPESNTDWEGLHQVLYATSLLADKQLLVLNFRDHTPNKAGAKILCDYLKNPAPDKLLLIDSQKADAKIQKSSWFKAVEKDGAIITIWPLPREQLPKWILDRAKQLGLTLNHDAAVLLSEYCEGNLSSAAQAIEKLTLLDTKTNIDCETVTRAIHDDSRFNIFDFVETMISGDSPRALHILSSLREDGTDPVLVLWAITRELRLLSTIANEKAAGAPIEKLFQKHRVFARRQTTIRRFLSTASEADCHSLLKHAASVDRIIKGAASGDAWQNLQLFCLRLV